MTFLLFWIGGFMAMFACYAPVANKFEQTRQFKLYMLPFPYLWLFCACGTVGAYFLTDRQDFIEPLTALRVWLPLALAMLVYLLSLLNITWLFSVAVIAAATAVVWIQPLGAGTAFPALSELQLRLIMAVFGAIFCLFYKIMNSTVQAFVIPAVMTLVGICVLTALDAAPLYSALCAIMLAAVLTAYLSINFYEVKIDLDDGACAAIALLIFNLLIMHIGEFSLPSCLVFTVVFWAELIMAVWHKFVVYHGGDLSENTNYCMAARKFPFGVLGMGIFRISAIVLFLGWFQLYAVNPYSLFIVALIIALWLNNSLGRPQEEPKTLKEINREFVQNLKQNIAETKELWLQHLEKKDK